MGVELEWLLTNFGLMGFTMWFILTKGAALLKEMIGELRTLSASVDDYTLISNETLDYLIEDRSKTSRSKSLKKRLNARAKVRKQKQIISNSKEVDLA